MLELGPTTLLQIANFVVLLVLLKILLWKPLMEALEGRHKHISSQVAEAEAIHKEAQTLKQQYESEMSQIKSKALEVQQEAKTSAERAKEQILTEARDEAARLLKQAEREANSEREKAKVEVKRYLADLTVATASKVLKETLDEQTQEKIMAEFVRKVGEQYVR